MLRDNDIFHKFLISQEKIITPKIKYALLQLILLYLSYLYNFCNKYLKFEILLSILKYAKRNENYEMLFELKSIINNINLNQ